MQRFIFVGGYGSGKSEVAVNYARSLHQKGEKKVHLIDLDVVNPYFRSREAIAMLENEGVNVVAPKGETFFSDRPLVVPEVRTLLANPTGKVIVDVGGDDAGSIVLSSLHDLLPQGSYELWFVLNRFRPFTDQLDGCLQKIWEVEQASGLKITGIVSNSHLLSQTDKKDVLSGIDLSRRVAKHLSLPLIFVSFSNQLKNDVSEQECGCPTLPLHLTLLRPWETKINV